MQIWLSLATLPDQKYLLTIRRHVQCNAAHSVNDNDKPVERLEMQPWKGKISEAEAWLKFGGNALSSHDSSGTVLSPAGTLRVNSDGSLSTFTAPSSAERTGYGFDALFHLGPFDLIGEYLSESYEARTAPGFPDFRADGFYVQGTYFIIPKSSNFHQYESFNPGQVANDDITSVTGGVNYYLHGDDLKIMAHYIHTWSDFRKNNPAFGQDEFDQIMLRLQLIY